MRRWIVKEWVLLGGAGGQGLERVEEGLWGLFLVWRFQRGGSPSSVAQRINSGITFGDVGRHKKWEKSAAASSGEGSTVHSE